MDSHPEKAAVPVKSSATPSPSSTEAKPAPLAHPDKPVPASTDELDLKPASGKVLMVGGTMLVLGLMLGVFFGRGAVPRAEAEPAEAKAPAAENNPETVQLDAVQVAGISLKTAELQTFHGERTTTGRLAFNDDHVTPVFTPYSGRITRLVALPGDTVQAGDTLFEIDTPDLVQAESDLIGAISTLKKSESALNLARHGESIAQRNVASSERNLELSSKNEARQKALFEDKAAALKDWEAAEQATQQARKDLEQAQKDLGQAQADVKSAENDIFANETVLAAARDHLRVFGKTDAEIAKIEQTRVIDRNTRVLAPISGTVTQRKAGVGQFVKTDNADPLYVIADLTTMWMLADVYESDAALLKLGLNVEVKVLAYPDPFQAKIEHIAASVDPSTHRLAVRCVVSNPGQRLKSEMFAMFHITTDAEIKSAAVPPEAVVQDGDKKVVWVAGGKSNQFQRREVATGLQQNGLLQIVKGVEPGEKVVAKGSLFLSNKTNTD